jgi:hypothetical protein
MGVCVEICQRTLWGTEVTLARIHVLIRIVTDRENACLPVESRAAPEAGSGVVGGRLCSRQNLLHGVGIEPLADTRRFNSRENIRIGRGPLFLGSRCVLLDWEA